MLAFQPRGGVEGMAAFTDHLALCDIGVSLGDIFTLVYPQPKRGGLIRVSVGCEDIDDLIEDFDARALVRRLSPRRAAMRGRLGKVRQRDRRARRASRSRPVYVLYVRSADAARPTLGGPGGIARTTLQSADRA